MDPNATNEDADFEAGFNSEDSSLAPDPTEQAGSAAAEEPAKSEPATPAPGAAEEPKPEPGASDEPKVDPFAALPEAVRDILAKVPSLQSELAAANEHSRRLDGLVRSLQSRIDKADAERSHTQPSTATPKAEPATKGERPKLAKLERVRETLGVDLPEVMDALDELAGLIPTTQHTQADPEPTTTEPAAATPQPQAKGEVDPVAKAHFEILDKLKPGWFETLESTDAQLWLATHPEMAAKYSRADTAVKLMDVLDQFDAHRKLTKQQQTSAATRTARMAAGVTPSGGSRMAQRPKPGTEDDGLNAGFYS